VRDAKVQWPDDAGTASGPEEAEAERAAFVAAEAEASGAEGGSGVGSSAGVAR
jgi:hypothetical protein